MFQLKALTSLSTTDIEVITLMMLHTHMHLQTGKGKINATNWLGLRISPIKDLFHFLFFVMATALKICVEVVVKRYSLQEFNEFGPSYMPSSNL